MSMTKEVIILIADDDIGHARLIQKNLQRAGLHNPTEWFENGQDILDFLFQRGSRVRALPSSALQPQRRPIHTRIRRSAAVHRCGRRDVRACRSPALASHLLDRAKPQRIERDARCREPPCIRCRLPHSLHVRSRDPTAASAFVRMNATTLAVYCLPAPTCSWIRSSNSES